jgi:hypothetical protein
MSKNILVKLGGTDVTAYLRKAQKTSTYGDAISKYELEFTKNVGDVVAITNALTCEVWEDSNSPPATKVFDGFIDLFKPEAGLIKITTKDKLAYLVNKPVMKEYDSGVVGDPSYPDGKISDIFINLIETYGGLKTAHGSLGYNKQHSYSMEDGSGSTVTDDTGNVNGRWSGTPWWDSVTKKTGNYSIGFNERGTPPDSNAYVLIPSNACAFAVGKISLYLYTSDGWTGTAVPISWKHNTGNWGYLSVNTATNKLTLEIDGATVIQTGAVLTTNTWQKIDLVWDGINASIDVDGITEGTGACTKTLVNIIDDLVLLRYNVSGLSYVYWGNIDDLEFYDYLSSLSIVDSGTEITQQKFTCRNANIFERCRKLAETLNWIFYYNPNNDYVYFEPKNYSTNPNTLTVGTDIVEIPIWEYDRSEIINDLRLEGAQQLVSASEVFQGNGVETEFTLTAIPENTIVYYNVGKNFANTAPVQSEIKIGDLPGSISTHDYEVDKKNKKITFTSFVPATGTTVATLSNILVQSTYYAPIPIHMENCASKAIYGTYGKTITLTDVFTLEDAWKRAENVLNKYSSPFKSAKLKVKWTSTLSADVGESIRIIDNINEPTIDQYFTIYKVIDYYPECVTEIEVGDKQYTIEEYQANVLERLKRVEETVLGTTDAVTEIVQPQVEFDLVPDTTNVYIQNINDSFIIGLESNAIIGTTKLGNRMSTLSNVIYTW